MNCSKAVSQESPPEGECSIAEVLAALPDEEKKAFLESLTPSQGDELNWTWEFWARPNQLMPKGGWLTWLLLAGRGFGKTRSAAEAVRALVCGATPLSAGKHARIVLVAETASLIGIGGFGLGRISLCRKATG